MEEDYFEEIERLEEERKKAIKNSDYAKIYETYNLLGIEPEPRVQHDYELGRIESNLMQGKLEISVEKEFKESGKTKRVPGRNFYIPRKKYELKEWIENYCEKNNKPIPKGFSKMKKKQLYAIYFNIMKR